MSATQAQSSTSIDALLISGAAGFIGSNLTRMALRQLPGARIVAYDKLTYAGNLANLADQLEGPDRNPRLTFVRGDICDEKALTRVFDEHAITHVMNLAAETHVDRSILASRPFVETNVLGTQTLLDVARAKNVRRFLQVSTDEVYGSLPENQPQIKFTEQTPLAPNSPYSASKAGADCLVRAYFHTFGMPVVITRCSNNYGPYQFPEKLIPLFITNLMGGEALPLYGDGANVRDWLHVLDHCEALLLVLQSGRPGEVYNIGGDTELTNRQVTEKVLAAMGKPWEGNVRLVADRPGHDRRYAVDAGKLRKELGFSPARSFELGLSQTVAWYRDNEPWWRAIKTGQYRDYYERQYGRTPSA
jgi:dTDP-glucose 4,6-dehydratase